MGLNARAGRFGSFEGILRPHLRPQARRSRRELSCETYRHAAEVLENNTRDVMIFLWVFSLDKLIAAMKKVCYVLISSGGSLFYLFKG